MNRQTSIRRAAVAAADKAEANGVKLSLLKANLDPGETTVALAAVPALVVLVVPGVITGQPASPVLVVLVGMEEVIRRMVANDHVIRRYTTLAQRLVETEDLV